MTIINIKPELFLFACRESAEQMDWFRVLVYVTLLVNSGINKGKWKGATCNVFYKPSRHFPALTLTLETL